MPEGTETGGQVASVTLLPQDISVVRQTLLAIPLT